MNKLSKEEETLHASIVNSSKADFIKTISEADNSQYNYMIEFIRKLKILRLPVPEYLGNLSLAEMEVAKKAQLSTKLGRIEQALDRLTPEQEDELVLIHFRGHVQYL